MTVYGILVFFKFEKLSEEEKEKARKEWQHLKENLPEDTKLVGVYYHAMGSDYNGFLLFEISDLRSFFDFWEDFKDKIRWYVRDTQTFISKKVE